jgi:hypothetical protein
MTLAAPIPTAFRPADVHTRRPTAMRVTLADGRRGFRRLDTGTVYVRCDGTWACPRKARSLTPADREHTLDFL